MTTTQPQPPETPPFRFDLEELRDLADDKAVRLGISYFREDRVMHLAWTEDSLDAQVEDEDTDEPCQVEITRQDDGELSFLCDCQGDAQETACKHAVAALMASTAHRPVSERELNSAEEEALRERQESARAHVVVRHVDGDRWFGTWDARSEGLYGPQAKTWRVQIRSLSTPTNHCNCPDFATNRLGTCKHVEAVLHHLRKRAPRKFERQASGAPPVALVTVDWRAPTASAVRLTRPADSAVPEEIERFFDNEGLFQGRMPDDLFALERAARGRSDLLLGDDVVELSRRKAQEAAQKLRAEQIRAELRLAGDRIPGVNARLYPYQVDGVAFLASSGRALLADDMGLGKTLQAIAAAMWLLQNEGARRVLIVCPASLKSQWAKEIKRFTGRPSSIVQGNPKQRLEQWRSQAEFTIANYELILRDHAAIDRHLAPDLLVLDEAQRIKNWRTKSAAAIKLLHTRYVFVLTGTPLENRLEDLYSLMQVIDPRVLGPLWSFLAEFHVTGPRREVLGYRNLSELRRRLEPVMLRRDRRLVSDQLPARVQKQVLLPLSAKQRTLHDEAEQVVARLASILRRRPLTPSEHNRFMAAMQRARMACNAAGLVDKETEGSPKLDELERLLEELCIDGDSKVVVFSQWERMTAMAAEVAQKLGLRVVRLHGGVPTRSRGKLMDRFADDPQVRVFLSTDAGGVGLNLQSASALINLDLPWNPAVLEQRIARIHRLGQKESVQVILLVSDDSYEQKIGALIRGKRELFDTVVDEDAEGDAVSLKGGVLKTIMKALVDGLEDDGAARGEPEVHEPAQEEPEVEPPLPAASPGEGSDAQTPQASAVAAPRQQAEALQRRVRAADTLLEAGFPSEALDLTVDALVGALADRLGQRAPARDAAAVWLFGELVPQGVITAAEAATYAQALALSNGTVVPPDLVKDVMRQCRRMLP